jgi:proto-oncogene tyrosine-protein kinase ROS
MAYTWPPDNRFKFETLADKPGAPGRPIVQHFQADVYKIEWLPANDNGAMIEEYALESMLSKVSSDRVVRSTTEVNDSIIYDENEIDDTEGEWIPIYNGTLTQYITKDLKPIDQYTFRVRARNSFGWGAYSTESDPVSEPFIAVSSLHYIYGIIGCLIVVTMTLLVIKCFISSEYYEKNMLETIE